MKLPEGLSIDEVMAAAEEEMFGTGSGGFCMHCGAEHNMCEPDARNYKCDACGERQVFGAAEILIMVV